MTAERWSQVKAIFDEAAELPPASRHEFLAARSATDDPELLSEVASLLESLDDAGEFIESSVITASHQASRPLAIGSAVGTYRIVQVIGEGGMGTVYQAVRSDDVYRKLVAIKVIKTGAGGEEAVRRFEAERQILAHLDHPNIARLLDGGATPEGQPYYVMEFIAGTPIDEYCDTRELSVRERLTLFLTVCSAVQYAHRNLVVHRDLKPQNILVSQDGTARLLDFGIAKLLNSDPLAGNKTASLMLMMTPMYASPEQVAGAPVSTSTDIYSLAVMLYQLLTGHTPFDIANASALDIIDRIRRSEPRKPSAVVHLTENGVTSQQIGDSRSTNPDRLSRHLSGDLDNILLLALRKDPSRRYFSVEQFAGDIALHLAEKPVFARPDTLRYRSAKFVRRHTAGVLGAVFVALALIGGIAATSWQAHIAQVERARAERRFNDIRGLANSVLFELHDAIEWLPGSTAARELLIKRAQQYLNSLANDAKGDRSLQRERAIAYVRIGDVLGLPTKANLGNSRGALESYNQALQLERALVAEQPNDKAVRDDLARTLDHTCNVEQSTGKFEEALKHCGEMLLLKKLRLEENPGNAEAKSEVGSAYQNLSGAYSAVGDWTHAERQRGESLAIFRDLHERFPDNQVHEFDLANAYLRMASVQEQTKHLAEGRSNAEKSVALFQDLSAKVPQELRRKRSVTFALQRLGSILLSLNDLEGARNAFTRTLPIREEILLTDPNDVNLQASLANNLASVGYVALKLGRLEEARVNLERQRDIAEKLVATDPIRIAHQFSYSEALENLGMVSLAKAQTAAGCALLRKAAGIYGDLLGRKVVTAEYAGVPARIAGEMTVCPAQP